MKRIEGQTNSQGRIYQKIPSGIHPSWLTKYEWIEKSVLLTFRIRTGYKKTKLLTTRLNLQTSRSKRQNTEWLNSVFKAAKIDDSSLFKLLNVPILLTIKEGCWAAISREVPASLVGDGMRQKIVKTYIDGN